MKARGKKPPPEVHYKLNFFHNFLSKLHNVLLKSLHGRIGPAPRVETKNSIPRHNSNQRPHVSSIFNIHKPVIQLQSEIQMT